VGLTVVAMYCSKSTKRHMTFILGWRITDYGDL